MYYLDQWNNLYTIGLQLFWASEREWLRDFFCSIIHVYCMCVLPLHVHIESTDPIIFLHDCIFFYWLVSLSRHIFRMDIEFFWLDKRVFQLCKSSPGR